MSEPFGGGPSTRLTARGAATRERIVAAAADLMYVQGVARTSLADIMAASATGTSQLYHYFTDKDALVHEVIRVQISRMLQSEEQLLARVDTLRGLRRWRTAEVREARLQGPHGCPLGSLATELACHSEQARVALAEAFQTWEGYVSQALARIQVKGELAAEADPPALAAGILSALEGGLLLAQVTREPARLKQALDLVLRQIGS